MKSLKNLKSKLGKKGQMLNDKQLSQVIGGFPGECGPGYYCSGVQDGVCIACNKIKK